MDIRALGPLKAVDGGTEVPLGGPKQRLVLAHLLLHANRPLSATWLVEAVWGDDPPSAARPTLQSYISHLRRALGADRITTNGAGYTFHATPDELDVLRFEGLITSARGDASDPGETSRMLQQALDLWSGSPFADLDDAPALRTGITRLEELRLGVLEDRIAAELEQDPSRNGRMLVGELEALVAEHPLRERLWGLLMHALYREGRQAEALAAYDRARRVLATEFGLDPSPSLRRTHARILDQDLPIGAGAPPGYRILERVGSSPSGVLYRAEQTHLRRTVALREVPSRFVDQPSFIRRFEAEAQAVARLEHPHIVPFFDYWRGPEGAYLVRRWHEGSDLGRRSRTGPVDAALLGSVAGQIGSALAVAHREGVTHGAVTAANILLDDEDNAYLSDFAIGLPHAGGPATDVRQFAEVLRELAARVPDIDRLSHLLRRAAEGGFEDGVGFLAALRATAPPGGTAVGGAPPATAPGGDGPGRGASDGGARDPSPPGAANRLPVIGAHAAVTPNPYKGLRPFGEADANDFFGREALVGRLVSRLAEDDERSRFLAVVGPSGSGKTSAVRAGLIPAIRGGALPGSSSWFVLEVHPGTDPTAELATALQRIAVGPLPDPRGTIDGDERGLTRAVERALPTPDGELLLVIDQFEEAFTLVEDEERRMRFLAGLVHAADVEHSRLRVVVTLRADFYDRPLGVPGLAELVRARTETVIPLTSEEVERAVTGPAARAGVQVEPGLVSRIVADVAGQPSSLPLLQYALTEVFDRRENGVLTRTAYASIGGVAGALTGRADELYRAYPAVAQDAIRQLFLRLVTLGEGVPDTRRPVPLAELRTVGGQPELIDQLIERFGRSRLLSFDRDPVTRVPPCRSRTSHSCVSGDDCVTGSRVPATICVTSAGSRLRRPSGTRPAATRASCCADRAST
jgi:DNA-binding SARP family transcriptional activator